MQPKPKRLCLVSEYSNYKTSFYTCKVAKKNKIMFYLTTHNSSILRSSRYTNYTLHSTSNVKLHLKTSNVPFLKVAHRLNSPPFEVFRPKQIKTKETWSWLLSWPYFEEIGLEVSWDNFYSELSLQFLTWFACWLLWTLCSCLWQ